jgi:hypothetical protein
MNLPFVSHVFEYSKMPNTPTQAQPHHIWFEISVLKTSNPIPKGIGVFL